MQTDLGASKYGMSRIQLVSSDQHAASNGAVTTANSLGMNADNPMLWLLAVIGVTTGLVAFSTSARVGKFAASVSAG